MVGEPRGKRIGAKILLNHEVGETPCAESFKPERQQFVECVFADSNRWVAPNEIESDPWVDRIGVGNPEVVQTETSSVIGCEFPGARIHVDGEDLRIWRKSRKAERNRTPSASEVEKNAGGLWVRREIEQDRRSAVESTVTENATVRDGRHRSAVYLP